MTWNTLTNLSTGQLVTETHMDNIRENIEHLGSMTRLGTALSALSSGAELLLFSGARVYSSVNVSIPNNSSTAVAFNSERYDTDTFHDNSTNNTRLTIGRTGKYQMGCLANFATNGTGYRSITIMVNGSVVVTQTIDTAPNASLLSNHNPSGEYELTAGQYIEVYAYQNSGGALNLITPEFWISEIH